MLKKALIFLAVVLALGAALLALGGVMLAEDALHPLRARSAVETDALVNRLSEVHGVKSESVFIGESDGTLLHAYWLPKKSSTKTVMILHGIGDSAYGSAGYAPFLLDHGFNVLLPDNRGQGQSSGINTFGLDESGDVLAWSNWLHSHTATTELDGLGESLGAGVVLSSLARNVPFHAVVAECAYSSFLSIADDRVIRYLPEGLVMRWAAKAMVRSGLLYVRLRYGRNLQKVSPVDAVRQTNVPILLIHGLADDRTSPDNSRRLAQANPKAVLWLVPTAGHVRAYATEPQEFERRVLAWFEQGEPTGS